MARSTSGRKPASRSESGIPARLAAIGLASDWDFVFHLPLRYEDETKIVSIDDLRDGAEAQIEATVTAAEVVFRGRRQLRVTVQDASGVLVLRFLHFYPSQQKQLAVGRRIRAFGPVRGGLAGVEMIHPRVRAVHEGEALPTALTPIYPTTAGVSQSWLRQRIVRALKSVELRDLLSEDRLAKAAPARAAARSRAAASSAARRRRDRAGRPHRPCLAAAEVRRTDGAADRPALRPCQPPQAARCRVLSPMA